VILELSQRVHFERETQKHLAYFLVHALIRVYVQEQIGRIVRALQTRQKAHSSLGIWLAIKIDKLQKRVIAIVCQLIVPVLNYFVIRIAHFQNK
jgi:hypothetical protein